MELFDLRDWQGFTQTGLDNAVPWYVDHITIDSRRIETTQSLFVALKGNQVDGHNFVQAAETAGAKYALVRRDWKPTGIQRIILIPVEDPLKALQQIAKSYRQQFTDLSVVGVVGSFGKTMVKDLLQSMVATTFPVTASPESFNSQIGVALSLLTIKKEQRIGIFEAGISESGEMPILAEMIQPDFSILTHVGKKHLASLRSLDHIADEMCTLLKHTAQHGWILLPNKQLENKLKQATSAVYYCWKDQYPNMPHAYRQDDGTHTQLTYRLDFPNHARYENRMTSGFSYFLDLINITTKAAWLLGISSENILHVLRDYQLEPMRTEIWKSPHGPTFINDMYSSDPQSIDQALRYLSQAPAQSRKIFVFGGMRTKKELLETDYKRIGKAINRTGIHHLVLVGHHPFHFLTDEVKTHAAPICIETFSGYAEAFNSLKSTLQDNDHILIKGESKQPLDLITEIFNESICNNRCYVNLAAIKSNLDTLRAKLKAQTRMMVMVKALAYGTNDIQMAKFLGINGIDIIGVSYVEEGVILKRAGISQAIFVINAALYEAAKVVKWKLEVGVSDLAMITALEEEAIAQQQIVKLHLHVNTGMGRFGCRPEEALVLAKSISTSPSLVLEGILTHFACAEDPSQDAFTLAQSQAFDRVISVLADHGIHPQWKHAANSAAAARFDFPQYNMVRVGLAVYGLYSSEAIKDHLDLRLALSMISRIVGINTCKAGETISYGRKYRVEREEQKIAVLPIGYFDGLHRNYSGRSHVIIRGQKAPMIGNICMDYMMADVTDIPQVAVGDPVLIFGEDEYGNYLSPEDLATKGESIIHELVTCLGPRIQRVFIHEELHQIR